MRRRSTSCWTIPRPILLIVLLTMGVNVYLYVKVPKGFFPQQDTGRLQGDVVGRAAHLLSGAGGEGEVVRGAGPDRSGCRNRHHGGGHERRRIRRRTRRTSTCSSSRSGVRKATSDQVIARLRRKTSGVPGATMFLQNSQDVRIGGRQGNAQYQYTLQAPDFDVAGAVGAEGSGPALDASGDCRRQLRPAELRACRRM